MADYENSDKDRLLCDFVLEQLSFPSMRDREEEVDEAHHDTFDWIFESVAADSDHEGPNTNDLARWLAQRGQDDTYWISGKPGSGKSTLMAYIQAHAVTASQLAKWAGPGNPVSIVSYFFWTSGSEMQKSQVGVLRSLFYQLFQRHEFLIPTTFPSVWSTLCSMSTKDRIKYVIPWTLEGLKESFHTLVDLFGTKQLGNICLFIDGLDECGGSHDEIINFLGTLQNSHTKLVLSSRAWPVFQEAYGALPSMRLQDLTRGDMTRYVSDVLRGDPALQDVMEDEQDLCPRLINDVVDRAEGVFLWVRLVARELVHSFHLHGSTTIAALRGRLMDFPSDLDQLYHYLLTSNKGRTSEDTDEAGRIIRLIRAREDVCDFTRDQSTASLTLWELALALEDYPPTSGWNDTEGEDMAEDLIDVDVKQAQPQYIIKLCSLTTNSLTAQCAGILLAHSHQGREPRQPARFGANTPEEDTVNEARATVLSESKVAWLHRTARDFITAPGILESLFSSTSSTFEPHAAHVRACVLALQKPNQPLRPHRRLDEWWTSVILAMTHARFSLLPPHDSPRVSSSASKNTKSDDGKSHPPHDLTVRAHLRIMIHLLDAFDATLSQHYAPRPTSTGEPDHWARGAFGTFELRMKSRVPFPAPFLCLASRFGLHDYIRARYADAPAIGIPLLAHALEYLFDRRKSIYPLSSVETVSTLLELGEDPNKPYTDLERRERTPWLLALDYIREGDRRGWIEQGPGDDGVSRWTQVVRLLLDHGADPNAVLVETRWDPRASAMDVIGGLCEKYPLVKVVQLKERLLTFMPA